MPRTAVATPERGRIARCGSSRAAARATRSTRRPGEEHDRRPIACADVARFLATDRGRYDLIFCDPPYGEYAELEPTLARYLPRLLAEEGLVVVETAAKTEPQLSLTERTSRRYGAARITLFEA